MALKLTKGSSLNLTKASPGLTSILLGCGWEQLAGPMDLDVSLFGLGADGKAVESHVIFFGQQASGDGSIVHTGDNRSGAGDGDDEVIKVLLDKVPAHIMELSVIITIDRAKEKNHRFGLLKDAYIRVINAVTNEVICTYDLDAEFNTSISVQVGSVSRNAQGQWEFKALGVGYSDKNFEDIAHAYGL